MSDPPALTDVLQQNTPWILVMLTTGWGVALRWLFGRAIKTVDQVAYDVADIKERLSHIEGHLEVGRNRDWE